MIAQRCLIRSQENSPKANNCIVSPKKPLRKTSKSQKTSSPRPPYDKHCLLRASQNANTAWCCCSIAQRLGFLAFSFWNSPWDLQLQLSFSVLYTCVTPCVALGYHQQRILSTTCLEAFATVQGCYGGGGYQTDGEIAELSLA